MNMQSMFWLKVKVEEDKFTPILLSIPLSFYQREVIEQFTEVFKFK